MHVRSYSDAGTAFTGDVGNNAGFSWSYQSAMRWSNGQDECPVVTGRRLEVQAVFAGQITPPLPAVMDDYGTLVIVGA